MPNEGCTLLQPSPMCKGRVWECINVLSANWFFKRCGYHSNCHRVVIYSMTHLACSTAQSLPLVGVSGVIWCLFSVTSTAAPTSPLKVTHCLSSWSAGRWYRPMSAFILYWILPWFKCWWPWVQWSHGHPGDECRVEQQPWEVFLLMQKERPTSAKIKGNLN